MDEPDENMAGLDIPTETVDMKTEYALSASFGFGGHNAFLVIKKYEQ